MFSCAKYINRIINEQVKKKTLGLTWQLIWLPSFPLLIFILVQNSPLKKRIYWTISLYHLQHHFSRVMDSVKSLRKPSAVNVAGIEAVPALWESFCPPPLPLFSALFPPVFLCAVFQAAKKNLERIQSPTTWSVPYEFIAWNSTVVCCGICSRVTSLWLHLNLRDYFKIKKWKQFTCPSIYYSSQFIVARKMYCNASE